MDDPRWLKLITIGLVLASLAIGYFLFSGRLFSNNTVKINTAKTQPTPLPSVLGENTQISPTPVSASAYDRIVNRTKDGVQVLPRTGSPVVFLGIISVGVMISGLGLRKFPN